MFEQVNVKNTDSNEEKYNQASHIFKARLSHQLWHKPSEV